MLHQVCSCKCNNATGNRRAENPTHVYNSHLSIYMPLTAAKTASKQGENSVNLYRWYTSHFVIFGST